MEDPLAWTIDRFREGKLPRMIQRAGYPTIAADLDERVVSSKLGYIESWLRNADRELQEQEAAEAAA